ncbi:MAG: glycosyl transferase, partial [Proteobacteria bacterium]
ACAPSRRYPEPMYAAAARALAARGWQVVLLGGAGEERASAERIARAARAPLFSLAGETSFAELVAAIALAPLLVANNSGPAHVAAAVGTPVVDLYALTNPQHTPWQVPSRVLAHDVPCRGCAKSVCPESHHLCLRGIHPQQVVDAVESLWTETAPPISTHRRAPQSPLLA